MKARNFRYIKPASLAEALRILADAGGEAVPVAGGQSLLAGLNMRLSAPRLLVDIGDLEELGGQSAADGTMRLGALTRHCELLTSEVVGRHLPLLRMAAPHIGHVAIRNRGTIGGSLAYADPAAELPACAVALGATLVLASVRGEREVSAEHFFKGLFETALAPDELIVAVDFPVAAAEMRFGFAELARRHGDFALAGLAAAVSLQDGRVGAARLVYFGCAERAKLAKAVAGALVGVRLPLADDTAFARAIGEEVVPDDTPGLRGDTRLRLATVLTRRVLNSLTDGPVSRMERSVMRDGPGLRSASSGLPEGEEIEIAATLNGKPLRRRVKARQHLADFLRQELELTGTHLGCEHGICGACTVLIDGRSARGCLTLAAQISGRRVDTIEGLAESGALAELQREFIAHNAAQCGFCSSGMLLTAHELVASGTKMSRAEIREAISGNMCRCTGYHAIVDAIEAVMQKGGR